MRAISVLRGQTNPQECLRVERLAETDLRERMGEGCAASEAAQVTKLEGSERSDTFLANALSFPRIDCNLGPRWQRRSVALQLLRSHLCNLTFSGKAPTGLRSVSK